MDRERSPAVIVAIWFTCVLTRSVAAQAPGDSLSVEVAAAQAMLKHQYVDGKIALNPVPGMMAQAPSVRATGPERPRLRSDGIATAIGGVVRRQSELHNCPAGVSTCRLSGVSAFLTLSEPSISGDSATVTATIIQNTPSSREPTDYETVLLTLKRDGGRWTVTKELQLGIS
jgi:hypothetical protein